MEEAKTGKSELKECCRCRELESKCVELEAEIEKKRSEYETLEANFKAFEVEKIAIEDELNGLKRRNDGNRVSRGRERNEIVDLTEDEDEDDDMVVRLMIENTVLECEKRKAESEVEFLKQKLKGHGLRALTGKMNVSDVIEAKHGNGSVVGEGTGVLQSAEIPYNDSASEHITSIEEGKGSFNVESELEYGRRVRKHLTFEEDQSLSKKMAPATPIGARTLSLGIVDVCDSDDEPDVACVQLPSFDKQGNGNVCISTYHASEGTVDREKEMTPKGSAKRVLFQQNYEENMDDSKDSVPFISTPKRKRASNIVTSDTESDNEDDNIPICKLKRRHLQEIIRDQAHSAMKGCSVTATPPGVDNISNVGTLPRRRLVSLRKIAEKSEVGECSGKINETKCLRGIPTTEHVEDDESEGTGSISEGESLNGFIVESSENSDGDDASNDAQNESDDNVDFDGILSILKRSKDKKLEWEFEADMLAAFGKDPELCMKAVCALYRQQTHEEKASKGTLVYNYRGFSKFDAHRGTTLAEFLTDGDPEGNLKKSVEELQDYNPKAVEMCRTFATRYSKQLFEIYKNKEDPLFHPSCLSCH